MSHRISSNEGERVVGGDYRDQYLIYNRKSTDDTENQKNSIKFQTAENLRFACKESLAIASVTLDGFVTNGIVSERHSGFKEDIELSFGAGNTVQYRVARPKFHRLVQLLSQRYFRGVIFLCWDRASRNKGDDALLRKLMKAGVDIRFTLAQYDKTSAGELHMDIDGMFAEHHSRVTREKVTIAMKNARARGLCTYKAPVGYLNLGSMERKPFDPKRVPIIRRMFELTAEEGWSLSEIARWAVDQGFTMPPVRRRRTQDEILAEEEDDVRLEIEPVAHLPTVDTIHKILTNPTYTGRTLDARGAWAPSASLDAIVSDDLFNKAQSSLHKRNQGVHYIRTLDHPFRRLIRCGLCRRSYTPYIQKDITYYGLRCLPGCRNLLKSTNFDLIASRVGEAIRNLSFTDAELAEIEACAGSQVTRVDHDQTAKRNNAARRKRVAEELAYLRDNKLALLRAGTYTPESYVAEETRLSSQLDSTAAAEATSEASLPEKVSDAARLSELLKAGSDLYDSAIPQEKDRVVRMIFSELALTENTLNYQCRSGFGLLRYRFLALGGPTEWLSELSTQHLDIVESIDELNTLLDKEPRKLPSSRKRRNGDKGHDGLERLAA